MTRLRDRETMERPRAHAPRSGPHLPYSAEYAEPDGVDADQRSQGIKDLVGGAVLIGIGFAFGGSVFLGNGDAIDWVFDGLGTFWLLKGLYLVVTA